MTVRRSSVSFDEEIFSNLTDISRRLGISKSAIVNDVLSTAIPELHKVIMTVIPEPKDPVIRRAHADETKKRLQELGNMLKQRIFEFDEEMKKF